MLKEQGGYKNKPISYDIRRKRESAQPTTGQHQNSLTKMGALQDNKAKIKHLLRVSDQILESPTSPKIKVEESPSS